MQRSTGRGDGGGRARWTDRRLSGLDLRVGSVHETPLRPSVGVIAVGEVPNHLAWTTTREGPGWRVRARTVPARAGRTLTREITTDVEGRLHREIHCCRIFDTDEVVAALDRCGFDAERLPGWDGALPGPRAVVSAVRRSTGTEGTAVPPGPGADPDPPGGEGEPCP